MGSDQSTSGVTDWAQVEAILIEFLGGLTVTEEQDQLVRAACAEDPARYQKLYEEIVTGEQ